ncbi:MAG TPA: 30S ribosomal protein S5 [Nanoarchaeota archaeon]|nr:30S ribosomal protein S5 [Nanoarchaeota archaeon]
MEWVPKTELGRKVLNGEINSLDEVFLKGYRIMEPEIVDFLLPNLKVEIFLIGGSSGKGGGKKRVPVRRTTRMHKSGRRHKISMLVAVGNEDGWVGIGLGAGPMGKQREVYEKAVREAKKNIIPILRGCGSWECRCGEKHSIPLTVTGKCGSVRVKLMPAPRGLGLCAPDEIKKLLRLAGIQDIWMKSRGDTRTRINFVRAVFDALKSLHRYKLPEEFKIKSGIIGEKE